MGILIQIFGEGKDLNTLQMAVRGVVTFFVALVLIRISGRRSFGIRTPFDNIIMILLGAILSRAVVGASSFLAVVICCLVIVVLHRYVSYFAAKNSAFGRLVEGRKILLFKNGKFLKENMEKGLVGEEDILQGVRKNALTNSMDDIDEVYIERNGEISVVRKDGR